MHSFDQNRAYSTACIHTQQRHVIDANSMIRKRPCLDSLLARWRTSHDASGRQCFDRYASLMEEFRIAQGASSIVDLVCDPTSPATMIRHWGEHGVDVHAEVINAAIDLCNVSRVADLDTLQRWQGLRDAYARNPQRGVAFSLMAGLAPDDDACVLLNCDDVGLDVNVAAASGGAPSTPEPHGQSNALSLSKSARKNRRRRRNLKARAAQQSLPNVPPSPEEPDRSARSGDGDEPRRAESKPECTLESSLKRCIAEERQRTEQAPLWSFHSVAWTYLGGCSELNKVDCAALSGKITGMDVKAGDAFSTVIDAAFTGCKTPASAAHLVSREPGGKRLAAPFVDVHFWRNGIRYALHRKMARRKDTWKLNTSTLDALEWPSITDDGTTSPCRCDSSVDVAAELQRLGVASPKPHDVDTLGALDYRSLKSMFSDRASAVLHALRSASSNQTRPDDETLDLIKRRYMDELLQLATLDLQRLVPGARLSAKHHSDDAPPSVALTVPSSDTSKVVPIQHLKGDDAAQCALVLRVALADMRVPPYDTTLLLTRAMTPRVSVDTLVSYLQTVIQRESARVVVVFGVGAEDDPRLGNTVNAETAGDGKYVVRG